MNKEEKRKAVRAAHVLAKLNITSADKWVKEGDKVRLNVERIKKRGDFSALQEEYRQFVNDNEDTIFTAHI